jgi:hypothetical protein
LLVCTTPGKIRRRFQACKHTWLIFVVSKFCELRFNGVLRSSPQKYLGLPLYISVEVFSRLPEATGATSARRAWPHHSEQPRRPPGYPQEPFATPPAWRGRHHELDAAGGVLPTGADDPASCALGRCAVHGRPQARRASSRPPPLPGRRLRSRLSLPSLTLRTAFHHTERRCLSAHLLLAHRT